MTTSAPARRRLPTWAVVLLWLAAAGIALVAAGVLFVVAMLSGGFDDLLGGDGPSEDDPRVVRARQDAEAGLRADRAELVSAAVTPALGATAVATGSAGECARGQHNWKIDDPYDLQCSHREVAVVPGGEVSGFRDRALALHEQLVASGWQARDGDGLADASSVAWVVHDYWDQREAFDRGASYTPADLPPGSYRRGGTELTVDWLAAGEGERYGWPPLTTPAGQPLDGDVGRLTTPTTWAAVLTLRAEYFSE